MARHMTVIGSEGSYMKDAIKIAGVMLKIVGRGKYFAKKVKLSRRQFSGVHNSTELCTTVFFT